MPSRSLCLERDAVAKGRDPDDELATLLGTEGEPEADEFWDAVATNLAARRLRLLFVADSIPDPLARVASFLNAEMAGIEVMAVEIKRFHGGSSQTLVPRVIGRTSASSRGRRPGSGLTRESFLAGFADADVGGVAERLLTVTHDSGGEVAYGGSFGLSIRVRCSLRKKPVGVAWLYSDPNRGWMRTRDFSFGATLLEEQGLPDELRTSSLGMRSPRTRQAWAIRHEAAVQHQDALVERLGKVVHKLASL